jgi:predicted ATPase
MKIESTIFCKLHTGYGANPASNPHGEQLIFSTHAIEVLNLVEKSQVMLVEKSADCISTANRLDTVEGIRNDDNFYAKYMGRARCLAYE